MRRQIQQRRLLKLIVDLGVFKTLVHVATKKDILPLLAVGKQYCFTWVDFKDSVIY